MKCKEIHWLLWGLGLVVAICLIARVPVTAATAAGTDADAPALFSAFNSSPEHKAIVKMPRETGADQIHQTAYSIAMSIIEDFADVMITCTRQDEPAEAEFYLFKENGSWVAYPELPTRKDHSAVFTTLARHYCQPLYKHLQISIARQFLASRDYLRSRSINPQLLWLVQLTHV